MSSREREGLIRRIRQIRRIAEPSTRGRSATPRSDDPQLRALEDRISHLEDLVQGFQDSVHRESKRQGERIADLEAQIQPDMLAKSLSEDARNRGL